MTSQSLSKKVKAGTLSEHEVKAHTKGQALWIFIPCLILWLLQMSIAGEVSPGYFVWPAPQKYMAILLQFFVWAALIYWVFFNEGAETLAKFSNITGRPIVFKALAILVVLSGIFALFSYNA